MADRRFEYLIQAKDEASKTFQSVSRTVEKSTAGVKDSEAATRNLAKTSKNSSNTIAAGFLKAQGAIAVLQSTFNAVKGAFNDAGAFEQNRVAFETILGSAEEARIRLAELSDFAATTPFELPQVVSAGKKLLAFGIQAEDLTTTLRSLGDISAGIGAPVGEIAEIFGKARVQGRLFAEDINQLTGRGIPVIGELAKQFGVAEGEIKKMVEEGKVGFNDIVRAFDSMTSEGGQFFNLMENQSKTFNGVLSNMTDVIGKVTRSILGIADTGDIIEGSLFDKVKDGVNSTVNFLNRYEDTFVTTFNDSFNTVGRIIGESLKGYAQAFDSFFSLFENINATGLNKSVPLWAKFFNIVNNGLDSLVTGIRIVGIAIGDALAAVGSLFTDIEVGDTFGDIEKEFDSLVSRAEQRRKDLNAAAISAAKDEGRITKSLLDTITDSITGGALGSGTAATAEKIKQETTKIRASFRSVRSTYMDVESNIEESLTDLENKHAETTREIKENIQDLKGELKDLEQSFELDIAESNRDIADEVIKQQERIKDIEQEIRDARESGDNSSVLEQRLRKEREALQSFLSENQDLQDEINAARERADKTDFERFVNQANLRQQQLQSDFEARKAQLQAEIAAQEESLAKENQIYLNKRKNIEETQKTFNTFKDAFIQGFDVMADNADKKIEFINRKLASLRESLEEINRLGGSVGLATTEPSQTGTQNTTNNNNNVNLSISLDGGNLAGATTAEVREFANKLQSELARSIKKEGIGSQ